MRLLDAWLNNLDHYQGFVIIVALDLKIEEKKRIVRATVQEVKTPQGIGQFVKNIRVGDSVREKHRIARNFPDEESYQYTWETEFSQIEFPSVPVQIKPCYWAQASVEYPRNRRVDAQGNILERERRVNTNDVSVLLVSKTDIESFLIVVSSYKPDAARIDKLIGEDLIREISGGDSISSDFFVWMYYSYNKGLKVLPSLDLNNIVGFTGIIADETNRISGTSDNMPELIITKAFVSNGYDLKSLRFDLNDTFLSSVVAINADRSLVMDLPKTFFFFDGESEGGWFKKMVRSTAYIYAGLLPAMLAQYDRAKTTFKEENLSFSKEIGIEVVQSIVDHNKISAVDIRFPVD